MAAFGRRTPLPEAATEARRLMAAELHARGFRDVFESADPIEDLRLRLTDGTQVPVRPLAERCTIEPRRIWAALAHHYVTAVLAMYADQRQALTGPTPVSPAMPTREPEIRVPAPGSELARPASAAQMSLTRELLANMPAPAAVAVDLPSPIAAHPTPVEPGPTPVEPVRAPIAATAPPPALLGVSATPIPAQRGADGPPPLADTTLGRSVTTATGAAVTPIDHVTGPSAAVARRPAPAASVSVRPAPSRPELGPTLAAAPLEDEGERFSIDSLEAVPARSSTRVHPHPGPPPPTEHLESLRRAVRARLLPAPPVGEDSWHYSRRVAPGLHVGLELLIGRTPRLLLDSEIEQMPFSVDELFRVGWRASAAEGIDDEREIAAGIRMISGASHYVATKAADLPSIEERFGDAPHGVVIAVPHRHALLFHTVWRDSVLVVEEMAQLAETLATGGPETTPGGGLSSSLYFWSDGRLERIDLGSEPSGRFATALATALI